MIDKNILSISKPPLLDNPVWEGLFNWRWWILSFLIIIALAFEFLSYLFSPINNLEQIRIFHLVLPYILILPGLGLIFLGLLETKSEFSQFVHFYDLQTKLRRELNSANDWDEFAARLYQLITDHYPVTGLSLLVYNQISEKFEKVAERFSHRETGSPVHYLPVMHASRQIASLYLYLLPDNPYPANKINSFLSLSPDLASAIERIQLLQSVSESIQTVRKKERDQIARQIHDTVGHDLAYLRLTLDQLLSSEPSVNDADFRMDLERMHEVIDQDLVQVRGFLSDLYGESQELPSVDLISHVRDCALIIGARANFQINFHTEGEPKILTAQMQRQVLYLVREILRNVEKHARAQSVFLTFRWIENGLTIKISDDGQGFDVNYEQNIDGHYGLKMMKEIVSELNGSITVVSGSNKGTQVVLWLPFN